jgi:hypothetical protein
MAPYQITHLLYFSMAKALQLFDPPYEESCRLSYLGFQNIYTAGNLSRIDVASNGY